MTMGFPVHDPRTTADRDREAQQELSRQERAALPSRPRVPCPACYGRRIRQTPEHTVERCPTCAGVGAIERPM